MNLKSKKQTKIPKESPIYQSSRPHWRDFRRFEQPKKEDRILEKQAKTPILAIIKKLWFPILLLPTTLLVTLRINQEKLEEVLLSQPQTPTILQPTPTPGSTSAWNTYRNRKYGFELNYPPGWSHQDYCETHPSDDSFYVCLDSPDLERGDAGIVYGPLQGGEIRVTVEENNIHNRTLCFQNYQDYQFPCSKKGINGIVGYLTTIEESEKTPSYPNPKNVTYFTFFYNNHYFQISAFYNQDSKAKILQKFNQILSTFRFIDKEESIRCGGIASRPCPEGYRCQTHFRGQTDAEGVCVKEE